MNWKPYRYVSVFAILTVLCLGFIFGQSLKPAKASHAESDPIVAAVKPILDPHDQMTEKQARFLVRKSAHLTEFAALGFCLAGFATALSKCRKQPLPFLAPFAALLAAVTDEYLQSFLDRTSKVEDVLIDFAGALIGILLMTLAVWIWTRRHKKTA